MRRISASACNTSSRTDRDGKTSDTLGLGSLQHMVSPNCPACFSMLLHEEEEEEDDPTRRRTLLKLSPVRLIGSGLPLRFADSSSNPARTSHISSGIAYVNVHNLLLDDRSASSITSTGCVVEPFAGRETIWMRQGLRRSVCMGVMSAPLSTDRWGPVDEDMDGSFRGRLTCTDWQKPQDRPSPNRDATSAEEQSASSEAAVDGAKRIVGW